MDLDSYEMHGDKVDMLNSLVTKLRDYIGDVEIHQGSELDIFHSDKTTIIVACSKFDYEKIMPKIQKGRYAIIGDVSGFTNLKNNF